jgi:hypothetical protein
LCRRPASKLGYESHDRKGKRRKGKERKGKGREGKGREGTGKEREKPAVHEYEAGLEVLLRTVSSVDLIQR